jgi:glycosyltransferase involved in cell wall biosynthesis
MESLSAVIITLNEEDKIGACIDSLRKVADEIIVLDSFSTDHTVAIAKQKGAIVKQEIFAGYIQQKNKALKFATYNYIISLDADETLSPALVSSILKEKEEFKFKAYSMNRYNHYCGKFIKHGLWYPDRKIRLFDKRIAAWGGINPHDKIDLDEDIKPHLLKGNTLHFTFDTIEAHLERNERMSSIAATSLMDADIKKPGWKIILSPAWSFFHGYLLRLGFLDGYYGFVIAKQTAHLSFLKYQKLHRLQKENKNSLVTALN